MCRRAPLLLGASLLFLGAADGLAQIYGYTDDNGVLILSNVPTTDRMRLIVDGTAEQAGGVWRYSGQYDPLISKASSLFGVDSALVRAVIAVESGFNRYARSHKGARGLMQLIPETGRRYGVENLYDPWQNIRGGTAHLRDLIDEFKDLQLALAAYNAGATPVRKYGTIPPYPETRNYVRKVLAIYGAGSKLEIIKGDRVYSIDKPGGRSQVKTLSASAGSEDATSPAAAGGSPLAQLARRVAAARASGAPAGGNSPGMAPLMAQAEPNEQDELSDDVYYRYVDPDGVVFITRSRPASYPYEVLQP